MRVLPCLALLLAGAPAWAADDPSPRIVVTGTASVATPPDRVEIGYLVRGEGPTSDDAVRALNVTRARILAGLAAMKAAPTARVNMVSVNPVRGRECQRYGAPQLSVGECAITGYVAELQVDVRTPSILDAGTIVSSIGRDGGLDPRIQRFFLEDDADARRRATAAAFANARRQAEALAQGAQVRLGALLSASDGSFGAQPSAEPVMVSASRLDAPPPPPPPPPPVPIAITPRPIETQARVTVAFAIAP